MTTMRISQLAERSGVPATTLRYYESAGLLPADRTPSGYRTYGEDAVTRLAFIGSAKHLGLPLHEIGELLAVWEAGACADVKADLRPRVAARLDEADHRITELAAFTASLHNVLEHLDALPDRQDPCDAECGFPSGHPKPEKPAVIGITGGDDLADLCDAGCGPTDRPKVGGSAVADGDDMAEMPIACSLAGDGVVERVAEWRGVIGDGRVAEIGGGVRVTSPVGRAAAVSELAAAEQRCCPFFDFRLCFDGDVVHLEVRAPAEAAGLIDELFAP
ncbi:heavy metal-responsive transcriptional regulator [Actinomadura sp. BRA 177]|uniref:heavy metal-responsive transcriptional regulator n=1 Tax=Actinomadura sp. BRA 177 TaxID=2745202 RepID=UPI00159599DE|nr:heavy metal-responsive transcriptional regulator [Actinomadura sp. BRA 177]NVI92497.1 heavy metal-responsive transcriptional regulator [Actinomadura sp. BRA 177]